MRARSAAAAVLVAVIGFSGLSDAPASATSRHVDVTIVSSPRGDLVTGGDALVRIRATSPVTVTVGRRDVTDAFVRQPDGSLLGLVTGLPEGRSTILARGRHGADALAVRNHPITGPVFSGRQQLPFFCETEKFGLAPAQQPFCAAPTVVGFVYRSTAGAFKPLADPTARPADLAQATVDGRVVPYIVRVERGTIDRAVYEIAALHDGLAPSPVRAHQAWNRRLVYTFGGGCNVGYHQGANTGGVLEDLFLARGYAVASSSLNVLDNNCSPVISAEVAMMVKERFIEEYGPVAHTIGWGGSGGAIQQYGIADNYPGILDGIIPQVSFPDPLTVGAPVADCRLLTRYFATTSLAYTDAQRVAVAGFRTWGTCVNWELTFANRGHAMQGCPPAIPPAFLYHPATNPGGIKCTTTEQLVNQLGRDPRTGFARSPLDNVGVQYGLAALRSGAITPEQFVDLNASLGGFDVVGDFAPARTAADPVALIRAYRSGLVLSGAGGLRRTPIIDLRVYTDAVNDIHTRFWSFATRARLEAVNGTSANQVILTFPLGLPPVIPQAAALDAMDRWLSQGRRPADAVDGCWTLAGARTTDTAVCDALFPTFADTRSVAGAPLADNVLKCSLRRLDFSDYPVAFTAELRARLAAVFSSGVCDYRRRGLGQLPLGGVWREY